MTPIRNFLATILLIIAQCVDAVEVDCTITVRSEPQSLRINLSKTPYEFNHMDFDNGFRFAGQVLEAPPRLKTYTYFDSKDRHVLIHEGIVNLNESSCGQSLGEHLIYSPQLEIDLRYNCKMRCE